MEEHQQSEEKLWLQVEKSVEQEKGWLLNLTTFSQISSLQLRGIL